MLPHVMLCSSVALSLVGVALATPHNTVTSSATPVSTGGYTSSAISTASTLPALAGTYTSFEAYTDDLTDCINLCWTNVWDFASAVCADSDIKCVCLIPEPNLDDPELAAEFGEITDCSTQCGNQDLELLQIASDKFANTCKPYLAQYGPIAPANHDYYLNALAQVMATNTAASGYPTITAVPFNSSAYSVVTSTTVTGPFGQGNATAMVPTPTASGPAVVTANSAATNGRWEMPILVAFVAAVGARLL